MQFTSVPVGKVNEVKAFQMLEYHVEYRKDIAVSTKDFNNFKIIKFFVIKLFLFFIK